MISVNEYMASMTNEEGQSTGYFYDLLPCKTPFGPPMALNVTQSGLVDVTL